MEKNINTNKVIKEDPFLTKNVWIKRLGLIILIIGILPSLLSGHCFIKTTFYIILGLSILTYVTKHIIGFFKSFNY